MSHKRIADLIYGCKIRKIFFLILLLIWGQLLFAQIKISSSIVGEGLINYASQYRLWEDQITTYGFNGSGGIKIGINIKFIQIESGLLRVYNRSKFKLANSANPVGFKFPNMGITFFYTEVPVNILFTPYKRDKVSIQSLFGFTYVINNGRGGNIDFFNSSGIKYFSFGNTPYAMEYNYLDLRTIYSTFLFNGGLRLNYLLTDRLSVDGTLLFKSGTKPLATASLEYAYYRTDILPIQKTIGEARIINNGSSIAFELGLRYQLYGKNEVSKPKKF